MKRYEGVLFTLVIVINFEISLLEITELEMRLCSN